MNSLFREFENENALRSYPFASGCIIEDTEGRSIGTGVIIDAAVYPVNASGTVYLSGVSPEGVVSISDDEGVIMAATYENGRSTLEFYDTSSIGRHSATLVFSSPEALSSFASVYSDRKFKPSATAFAASCLFPISNDGVTSICVNKTEYLSGTVAFANGPDDQVRVSTDGSTLRFDVVPLRTPDESAIKHIYCVVDGKTPFRIIRMHGTADYDDGSSSTDPSPGNAIALYLDGIDRGTVCSNVHREDAYEMADTCEDCSDDSCPTPSPATISIPDVYQCEAVDMPNGANGAFYLTAPNFLGYDNPMSITLSDGIRQAKTAASIDPEGDNLSAILDTVDNKGIILQVPGLKKEI